MPVALITGASRGLGLAIAHSLHTRGWQVVLDARGHDGLASAAPPGAVLVVGDVTDPGHRARLHTAVAQLGRLDLLVNNASELGPMPALVDYPLADLRRVYEVDVFAPLALVQLLLPLFADGASVVNVSSDAAIEAYGGWGGYGSAKAALDQLSAVLAVEQPGLRVHAFDPGDMRTAMHQQAFPGEDISDRPTPESVVPALLRLLELPSGRYRADELAVTA
ncbi:MAG: SDR family oxidoreductase [Frankiales bacterium]|nr:SDR family oxidoreductase [Frankiales bacterium]